MVRPRAGVAGDGGARPWYLADLDDDVIVESAESGATTNENLNHNRQLWGTSSRGDTSATSARRNNQYRGESQSKSEPPRHKPPLHDRPYLTDDDDIVFVPADRSSLFAASSSYPRQSSADDRRWLLIRTGGVTAASLAFMFVIMYVYCNRLRFRKDVISVFTSGMEKKEKPTVKEEASGHVDGTNTNDCRSAERKRAKKRRQKEKKKALLKEQQQRQQQQQQQQQRASQAVEDKESNEIRPLMDGLTSYQEPRAKLTSADISDIKQQAAGDSMNEASSSTCIAPSSMPQNRLPMPPIYATSAETFACSNATSSGSSNIHYPAETLPLPVGIVPPQQKQSQHQQVDINTHSSMLASVIGTPKGDGRDIVDATLFSRHTPIQANPMWMNTCKIETKQEESATSKQGTAERTSKMHAARSTRSKEAEPVAKRAVRIFSHKMDEKDNETQSPQDFFIDLIGKRGYSTNSYSSLDCGYHTAPSPLQLASFGTAVIKAVESDDSEQLSALLESGLSRNPCSSFSDYILCRSIKKGCVKSFRAQVEAGADLRIADDFGRTALHHAAWAQSPNFEIVDVILKADKNMLRLTDRLGRTPLNYAHGAHRAEWIEHLKEVVNDFWPENGKDWHEEEVPPKVVREGGMIADPADALPAHEASLIAMGKVAPTATDGKNTVSTSSDTPESDASETSASAGKRKKLDTSNSRQNFVNAKKLATRSPSSGKKVVASRCA